VTTRAAAAWILTCSSRSGFAEEQAALRRVATLVAGASDRRRTFWPRWPSEVGRLLDVDYTA
jgi:hypothetical protein